jgi:hypothetical protein
MESWITSQDWLAALPIFTAGISCNGHQINTKSVSFAIRQVVSL